MKRRSNKKTIYSNVYSHYKPPKILPSNSSLGSESTGGLMLYRYTFTSRVTIVAALLLCISLLIQPVAYAYAEENAVNQPDDMVVEVVDLTDITTFDDEVEVDVSVPEEADVTALAIEKIPTMDEEPDISNESNDTGDSEGVIMASEPDVEVLVPNNGSSTTNGVEGDIGPVVDVSSSTISTATSTAGSDSDETVEASTDLPVAEEGNTEPTNPIPDTTPDSVDTTQATTSAATSTTSATTTASTSTSTSTTAQQAEEESVDIVDESVQVTTVQSDQSIAFNKNECTEVSDGSFYCQKLSLENQPADALFAAPDSTGDMEIYVVQDGVERKLTDNVEEDASPYYDARSETIVWHRLVNDRYQIISYDIETGEETQLTNSQVNNMEPARNGDYTVWQRWVSNNWEIILFDGEEEIQLTDSVRHDIAPNILGDLIIWNVRSSDGTQSLMTYEISSETYNEITDKDGVSVMNPRMLVMYEAQYQNGDTVMKGFDLATGEIVPIERFPRELPTNIPEPDATGEVRALPANPNNEEDQDTQPTEPEPDEPPTPVITPQTATTSATTTIEFELDLRPTDLPVATTTDLVVERAAIPDVVIPLFVATSTNLTSSSTQDS